MLPPALPKNEQQRLAKLQAYDILDTTAEESFDRVTRIISRMLDVPIALVSLVDKDRQWFKSRVGLDASETPREISFCGHAIHRDELFVVEDATKDDRFADNPLVTGPPHVRFYAGAPLRTNDGFRIGTLCAIDQTPHQLSNDQRQLMLDLACVVIDELELRLALFRSKGLVDELEEAKLVKDEFVSTVNHELRTPLTSIMGSLGLIRTGATGPISAKTEDMLEIAHQNSERLINLVNDILDVEKIEAGKMEFEMARIDLVPLMTEAITANQSFAERFGVKLEISTDLDTAAVRGDPDRLMQAITNLISNGAKFSPADSTVELGLIQRDDHYRLSVRDHGPGIAKDFQPRLFEKFSQSDSSDSRQVGGTGLGLNISQSIIEAHGGTIGFETAPGTGSVFVIDLPVVSTAGGT